jgi:glucokinase
MFPSGILYTVFFMSLFHSKSGTKCAVSIGKGTLEPGREAIDVIDRVFFLTAECKTPEETVDRACREMKMLIDKYGENNIASVGISCGGPLDGKKGMVLSPPNLPGWDEFPVVRLVEEKTGIRAKLSNDADACALAEWKFGAGKGCKNMVFLTFGTGFGAGLILNGALYTGANNMAGEIGHIRLERFGPVGYGKVGLRGRLLQRRRHCPIGAKHGSRTVSKRGEGIFLRRP